MEDLVVQGRGDMTFRNLCEVEVGEEVEEVDGEKTE